MSSRSMRARASVKCFIGGDLWCRSFLEAGFDQEIWQAGGLDFTRPFQDQGALDDIAEFAHIARPPVRKQFLPRSMG